MMLLIRIRCVKKDSIDTASEAANELVNNVKNTIDPSTLLPVSQVPNIVEETLSPLIPSMPEILDAPSEIFIPEVVSEIPNLPLPVPAPNITDVVQEIPELPLPIPVPDIVMPIPDAFDVTNPVADVGDVIDIFSF